MRQLGLGPLAWDHNKQRWTRMLHPLDSLRQVEITFLLCCVML